MVDYHTIITLQAGKRSGKPCVRGLRITVQDVLDWLASGMTLEEILVDYPELTRESILIGIQDVWFKLMDFFRRARREEAAQWFLRNDEQHRHAEKDTI